MSLVRFRPSEDGSSVRDLRGQCENIIRKLSVCENKGRQPGDEADGKSPAAYLFVAGVSDHLTYQTDIRKDEGECRCETQSGDVPGRGCEREREAECPGLREIGISPLIRKFTVGDPAHAAGESEAAASGRSEYPAEQRVQSERSGSCGG